MGDIGRTPYYIAFSLPSSFPPYPLFLSYSSVTNCIAISMIYIYAFVLKRESENRSEELLIAQVLDLNLKTQHILLEKNKKTKKDKNEEKFEEKKTNFK